MSRAWTIRVASDGRRVDDAEPHISSDRTVKVVALPDYGDGAFDVCVDALIGKFHMPEDHAISVVATVIAALGGRGG